MAKTIHLDPDQHDSEPLAEATELVRGLLGSGKHVVVTIAEEDELLSPHEAAERLGFSRQHVRRLIDAGELEGSQLPNSDYWKIPLASLVAFEERRAEAGQRADALSRSLDELGAPPE